MADEIDEIISGLDASTNEERPMSAPESLETQAPAVQQPEPQEFSFNADGRDIRVPLNDPRIKQWAAMGYSAPTRMGQLNQQIQKYESQVKEYDSKYKPFMEMDEWSRKNPEAWQRLDGLWREQLSGMSPQQQAQIPPEVKQKLDAVAEKVEAFEQEKIEQRNIRADQSLDQEIGSIRKTYPNLDLTTPDKNGNSLEYKVLQHGIQNGIPNFTASFRDYCHDQLVKLAEDRGREGAGKSLSRAKNLGLQGRSPAPNGSHGRASNLGTGKQYAEVDDILAAVASGQFG